MTWREAFLRQARSENAVRLRLNHPKVEYAHRLHYLQMVSEKLSKALQIGETEINPPPPTHRMLVRLLQVVKGRPGVRKRMGYADATIFRTFIDSLLPLASEIERLAPSAAGFNRPNPEYPWRERPSGIVHVPAEYPFSTFSPRDPKMIKFERLLNELLRMES